jgi:hypothetical protein
MVVFYFFMVCQDLTDRIFEKENLALMNSLACHWRTWRMSFYACGWMLICWCLLLVVNKWFSWYIGGLFNPQNRIWFSSISNWHRLSKFVSWFVVMSGWISENREFLLPYFMNCVTFFMSGACFGCGFCCF